MTQDQIERGIHDWAVAAKKLDWFNERNWWIRLVHWYHWKFRGVYLKWESEDEIAASIMAYIEKA